MSDLNDLVRAEITQPVRDQVAAFAAHIASGYKDAARAVLFYGSCLRSERLEGEMLDFYLIVSDYDAAYSKKWMAKWNRRLPPNVFPAEYEGLRAKIAVLSEADFARLCSADAPDVSVWARFSQPSRLAWTADEEALERAVYAIAGAAPALLDAAAAHEGGGDLLDLWRAGFALTYGAELRAERKERPASVVDHQPERYRAFGAAALEHCRIAMRIENGSVRVASGQGRVMRQERARWPRLRRRGKLITLARLAKATATYAGGIDYIAWKINRHAKADIRIAPWQRRHPILGALTLLPRLIATGAIR